MGNVKLKYYYVRNGRGYFEIGKARAERTGLPASEPLGPDGPDAWSKASACYEAYKAAMGGADKALGGYAPGTLGAIYSLWKASDDWSEKEPRTREDYDRAWSHIAPEFGRTLYNRITVADSERFHRRMIKTLSPSERFRVLKCWRAILNMLEKKGLILRAPIGMVANSQPKGRGQFWLAHEVEQLAADALAMKSEAQHLLKDEDGVSHYRFMNLMIRLAWETALAPVDVRTFSIDMLKKDPGGWYVDRSRQKTGAEAKPAVSGTLAADLLDYHASLPVKLLPGAPLFRTPDRHREISKNYMVDVFQRVRAMSFGTDADPERRQFLDIRRSANLEAALGGASPEERGAVLANAMAKNKHLEGVYTPGVTATSRKVARDREAGRQLLAQEMGRPSK